MDVGFDDAGFFEAIERRRNLENLSWRQLAKRLGLSASTFSRLARGRRPDVDTFVRLVAWLEMPAESFMINAEESTVHGDKTAAHRRADTLEVIAGALRADRTIPSGGAGALEQLMRVAYANLTGSSASSGGQQARSRSRSKRS